MYVSSSCYIVINTYVCTYDRYYVESFLFVNMSSGMARLLPKIMEEMKRSLRPFSKADMDVFEVINFIQ